MEELYERFFSTTHLSTQVMETGSRIAHEIADALDALKKAGATTERYGATLNVAARLSAERRHRRRRSEAADLGAGQRHDRDVETEFLAVDKLAAILGEMEKLRTSLRQARAEALTDALTGIANRKLFDETLRLRKEEADDEKTELALLLCDIDHFKSFNDTWGHQTGDQVIRFVASTLDQVRPARPPGRALWRGRVRGGHAAHAARRKPAASPTRSAAPSRPSAWCAARPTRPSAR